MSLHPVALEGQGDRLNSANVFTVSLLCVLLIICLETSLLPSTGSHPPTPHLQTPRSAFPLPLSNLCTLCKGFVGEQCQGLPLSLALQDLQEATRPDSEVHISNSRALWPQPRRVLYSPHALPAADAGAQRPSDAGLAGRAVAGSLWWSGPSGTPSARAYTSSPIGAPHSNGCSRWRAGQKNIPITTRDYVPLKGLLARLTPGAGPRGLGPGGESHHSLVAMVRCT